MATQQYYFDMDANGFPLLTEHNIEFIKALVKNDPGYRQPIDNDYKIILSNHFPNGYNEILNIVKLIDRADSTHLASEGSKFKGANEGREITAEAICQITDLKDKINNGDTEIIDIIANAVNEEHKRQGKESGKYNFSFATKFCAYVSLYALNKDNYCIYDKVVSEILPYYLYTYLGEKHYRIKREGTAVSTISEEFKKDSQYIKYRQLVDKLIESVYNKHNYRPSYKEIDGLLWYYFKGENSRIVKAMETLK